MKHIFTWQSAQLVMFAAAMLLPWIILKQDWVTWTLGPLTVLVLSISFWLSTMGSKAMIALNHRITYSIAVRFFVALLALIIASLLFVLISSLLHVGTASGIGISSVEEMGMVLVAVGILPLPAVLFLALNTPEKGKDSE